MRHNDPHDHPPLSLLLLILIVWLAFLAACAGGVVWGVVHLWRLL
jgi:hypothetical protein